MGYQLLDWWMQYFNYQWLLVTFVIKKFEINNFFTTLNEECVDENFNPYKRKDNNQLSEDMIQSGLLKKLSQLSNK